MKQEVIRTYKEDADKYIEVELKKYQLIKLAEMEEEFQKRRQELN